MLQRELYNSERQKDTTMSTVKLAKEIDLNTLSKDKLVVAKQLIRDGIGVLLLGMEHETSHTLNAYFKQQETLRGIRVLNNDFRISPTDASFIYGCAIHSMDFEPMFLPPTHAVSPILSPLVALSQNDIGSGNLFLKSFIAAIQFEADLRKGAYNSDVIAANKENHFPFERSGFHPPGTVGPLGSALASSLFMGLTDEETSMAIGMSASRSSGISGNIGTQTKSTHCGSAARSGLESALLVKSGISASTEIIESQSGWGQIFGGEYFNYDQMTEGMKNVDCFTSPGFGFKKWPAHTAMQVAISTGLKLHSHSKNLERLKIQAPVFKYCDRPFPRDTDEARFSFQYNSVIAILDGYVDNNSYTEEKLNSEKVQNLLQNTELIFDSKIPKDFGKMHVIIETNEGRKAIGDRWPGHWKSPMSEDELLDKFVGCTSKYWSKSKALKVSELIMNIEVQNNFKSLFRELDQL